MNDKLIKLVDKIYQLEREVESIQAKCKPLRETLLKKIKFGKHQIGEHLVIKMKHKGIHIKAYDRKPYITLQVK